MAMRWFGRRGPQEEKAVLPPVVEAKVAPVSTASAAGTANKLADRQLGVLWLSGIVGLASYGVGIIGLVTSFTGIKAISPP